MQAVNMQNTLLAASNPLSQSNDYHEAMFWFNLLQAEKLQANVTSWLDRVVITSLTLTLLACTNNSLTEVDESEKTGKYLHVHVHLTAMLRCTKNLIRNCKGTPDIIERIDCKQKVIMVEYLVWTYKGPGQRRLRTLQIIKLGNLAFVPLWKREEN